MTKASKAPNKKVLVTIPAPLLKKLDAKARAEQRTRSAELCIQLGRGMKVKGSERAAA